MSLCQHGVICKKPLSVNTGRSSDLKQSMTLVIPQAAWNRNILVFNCKVQGERSPNLEEADIQYVFKLLRCWVTYEGPQIAESTQWSKAWRIFWHCCGEVCSKETCRWGIVHFFEADNIIEFEHMMETVMLTKKMYEEA